MKKQMIWGMGLILLVSVAFAIYGGNSSIIYSFDKCKDLQIIVNGSLEITEGEYSLNCGINNNNTWSCDCYDGFQLKMNTTILTVNNYTLNMDYGYDEVIIETSGGSGGRSRRARRYVEQEVIVPEPEPQKNKTNIEIPENIITEQNETDFDGLTDGLIAYWDFDNETETNETIVEIQTTQRKVRLTFLLIMIALFVAGLGIYFIFKI